MKALLLSWTIILIVGASGQLYGQKSVHKFIDEIKERNDVQVISLPGWIVRRGLSWVTEADKAGYQDISKGIKSMRIAFTTDRTDTPQIDCSHLLETAKQKDGMEEYVNVKDKGSNVVVLVREINDVVKNITIVTQSDEGLAIVTLKTKIAFEQFKNANFSFNEN